MGQRKIEKCGRGLYLVVDAKSLKRRIAKTLNLNQSHYNSLIFCQQISNPVVYVNLRKSLLNNIIIIEWCNNRFQIFLLLTWGLRLAFTGFLGIATSSYLSIGIFLVIWMFSVCYPFLPLALCCCRCWMCAFHCLFLRYPHLTMSWMVVSNGYLMVSLRTPSYHKVDWVSKRRGCL